MIKSELPEELKKHLEGDDEQNTINQVADWFAASILLDTLETIRDPKNKAIFDEFNRRIEKVRIGYARELMSAQISSRHSKNEDVVKYMLVPYIFFDYFSRGLTACSKECFQERMFERVKKIFGEMIGEIEF